MKNTAKRSVGFLPLWSPHAWGAIVLSLCVKTGSRKALRAKFEQHAELRALLLATAPAKLVEHTENDAYWGDGGNGKGKNRLGYLLMELREQLAIEK